MPMLSNKDLRIILLGDTHVPDRIPRLPKNLLAYISDLHPDLILHTGDVCTRKVLSDLAQIAPMNAVQGNRDWFMRLSLPPAIQLELNGVHIILTHGHGTIKRYLRDLFRFVVLRHDVEHTYYQQMLAKTYSHADVILYGHTHYQVDEMMQGIRFINPGSIYPCKLNNNSPAFALLHISANGELTSNFHTLPL